MFSNKFIFDISLLILSICFVSSDKIFKVNLAKKINEESNHNLRSNDINVSEDLFVESANQKCDCGPNSISCEMKETVKTCVCKTGYSPGQYGNCVECKCQSNDTENGQAWFGCEWGPQGEKLCNCSEGYAYDPSRGNCSVCDCGEHSKSCEFNSMGSKFCVCHDGYKYASTTEECEKCDCGKHGMCTFETSLVYLYKKCICDSGYVEFGGICAECDCGKYGNCAFYENGTKFCECEYPYSEKQGKCAFCFCGDDSACAYDGTNKRCYCRNGYEEVNGFCMDIDECKQTPCGASRNCINTLGSYKCECKEGYQLRVEETVLELCEDINECLDSKTCTDPNTECMNTPGSYKCICKSGFASRGNVGANAFCKKTSNWTIYSIVLVTAIAALIVSVGIAVYAKRNYHLLTRNLEHHELH